MVDRKRTFFLFELRGMLAPIITKKRKRVVMGQQAQRVMPRQFYNLPKGVLAVLGLLMEGMHQQIAVLAIECSLTGRRSQPVTLREILQKLSPLDGVTIINIDLLKQFDQFIANEVRLLFGLFEGLPH